MKNVTRREFLQTTTILLAASVAGSSFNVEKNKPALSFSSLGCPDWTFEQMVNFAVKNGYNGIELRGVQRELDLTKCKEFSSVENKRATIKMMKDNGLKFVGLGSSATMHFADAIVRKKNLDEGRSFIDLAHEIGCPNIRVFPNLLPKDQDKNVTMDLIVKGLLELGDYAKGSGVHVLMESHGDLVKIDDIENIMQSARHDNVGLVWDVTNMWTLTKEPPVLAYEKLKKYIKHTHIKDAKIMEGKLQYTYLGQGEVPIFEAIDALEKGGYSGFYSFEWEKLWHPELGDPALALADYTKVMQQHFLAVK